MSEYLVSTNVADIQYHFNHTTGGYLETLATTQCQTGKCINMQHTCAQEHFTLTTMYVFADKYYYALTT